MAQSLPDVCQLSKVVAVVERKPRKLVRRKLVLFERLQCRVDLLIGLAENALDLLNRGMLLRVSNGTASREEAGPSGIKRISHQSEHIGPRLRNVADKLQHGVRLVCQTMPQLFRAQPSKRL